MARKRLVFVPGFLASMIFRPSATDPNRGELVWMSYQGVILGDYKYLDPTLPGSQIGTGRLYAGPPLEHYHAGWYEFAKLPDVRCTTWGYDFRNSVYENAQLLGAHLNYLAESCDELNVVGHSMGGLVAARAFDFIQQQHRPKFKKFVTYGTPWHGSYATVGYLCGFGPTLEDIAKYNSYANAERYRLNKEFLKTLLARWPGLYDLLPSPALVAVYDPGREGEVYDADNWTASNPVVNQTLLNNARAYKLQPLALLPGQRHLNIVGVEQTTPGPLPTLGSSGYLLFKFAVDGDGVVPTAAAVSPYPERSATENLTVDHLAMPNAEGCHWFTREFLDRN